MTYGPEEDSYFLKERLEQLELEERKVLDMGTGSGILAITAAKEGAEVAAVDIDPGVLEDARRNARETGVEDSIEFIESDLFENVEGRFDFIVFNPPYLPGERYSALDGGETGIELTKQFLEDSGAYLMEDGEVLFLASSRSDFKSLEDDFDIDRIGEKELWFETLYLFRSD